MLPQPLGQGDNFLVGPHPGRPAFEGMQHIAGALPGIGQALDITIDLIAVGPVAFNGDEGESRFRDQPLADAGPPLVVLGGAVGSLAQ